MTKATIIIGDNRQTLKVLPAQSVQTVITSPPYWGLRDYGQLDQIGLETSPDDYVEQLCQVFDEVWRVLKDDGTLWLNLGDSYASFRDSKSTPDTLRSGDGTKVASAANRNPYSLREAGLKHKDLVGIPWRVAFALQARGWYLRQDIIWAKPNPMPESVTDRCTKSHEYLFLLTKSPKYFFDNQAIKEPSTEFKKSGLRDREKPVGESIVDAKIRGYGNNVGVTETRNKRDVWTVAPSRYKEAHFATYPPELILPCILAGSKPNDLVLDPFSGSGTTGVVAMQNNRNYVGLELNPEYASMSEKRLMDSCGVFGEVEVQNGL